MIDLLFREWTSERDDGVVETYQNCRMCNANILVSPVADEVDWHNKDCTVPEILRRIDQ